MAHPRYSVSLSTRLWPFWDYDSSSLDAEQLTTLSKAKDSCLALTNSPFGTPEFIAALSAAQSVLYRNNLMMLALD